MFKDICRICLQEADYQDVHKIDLQKFDRLLHRPFLNFAYIRKWQIELFRNHLICDTCIHNFRTMKWVYSCGARANTAIITERNKHQLNKVNLKRLKRFSHIEGDFIVCRLCLEPTRQIAVYLYDNNKNILPKEYIKKMLKLSRIYTGVQISFSFSKHLKVVSEKVYYYQVLVEKNYLDREDLENILDMWDHLDTPNIKMELDVVVKTEFKEEVKPALFEFVSTGEQSIEQLPILQKNISDIENNYSFYDEHNYFRIGANINDLSENRLEKNASTAKDYSEESNMEMPVLTPIVNEENCNEEINSKIVNVKRVLRERLTKKAKTDEKLRSITTYKGKEKQRKGIRYKESLKSKKKHQKDSPDVEKINETETEANSRPRTRLSTKRDCLGNEYSNDLLVLRKEEIVKKKRQVKKCNISSVPNHTSTPKPIEKLNVTSPVAEISLTKINPNVEYRFETINLDNVVKKETIEEEELQIKREIVSEGESDEHFNENTGGDSQEGEEFNDECPNLESFIKSEPPDYIMDLDEEGPPELEFQGLCVPAPLPCFTIQNTFTVDEKRQLVNSVEDKRDLLNQIKEKVHLTDELRDEAGSAGSSVTPSEIIRKNCGNTNLPNNSFKPGYDKLEHRPPLIKVKQDLVKKDTSSKTTIKGDCLKQGTTRNLVISLKKIDDKLGPALAKPARPENSSCPILKRLLRNSPVESQPDKRLTRMEDVASRTKEQPAIKYRCQSCSFSSLNEGTLLFHIKKEHLETKKKWKWMCAFCKSNTKWSTRICIKCNRTFHPACLRKDLKKLNLDCYHVDFAVNEKFTEVKIADASSNPESFIYSEPPDCVVNVDEEGPPELEFQGPCVPTPLPCFTIQDTFTVDEKRHMINSIEDKKNLLNQIEEKVHLAPSVRDEAAGSSGSLANRSAPSGEIIKKNCGNINLPSNFSNTTYYKKLEQKPPLIKVKKGLVKKYMSSKTTLKGDCLKDETTQNPVINFKKIDDKVSPTQATPDNNSLSNIARVESQPDKRSTKQPNSINYYCQTCGFSSVDRWTLLLHLKREHWETEKKVKKTCAGCKGRIMSRKKLCMKCHGTFHNSCLKAEFTGSKSDCDHLELNEFVLNKPSIEIKIEEQYSSKYTLCCDVCNKKLQLWINCKKCEKNFHYHCFGMVGLDRSDGCKHNDLASLVPYMLISPREATLKGPQSTASTSK